MSINRVCISGNLTRDAELRATTSGTPVLSLSVAVNDRRKNPQTGDWEDWEQEGALQAIRSSLLSLSDSQGALENFYLGQIASGVHETPEELAAELERVTKERIVAAARTVHLDTVYFLGGRDA